VSKRFDRGERREKMQLAEVKQACEYVEYGNICDSQGLYEKALDAYDRALRIIPDDADALFDKGETLVKIGRPQEATACFTQAMQLYAGA
jgi:tetratricopeptide (TPR) repeat protein